MATRHARCARCGCRARCGRGHLCTTPAALPSCRPQVFISIAVFIVDGAYIVVKLAILSYKSVRARKAAAVARAAAGGAAPPAAPTDKAVPPSTAELGPEGVAPFDGDTALKDVSEAADMEAEADGGHHTLVGRA